LGSAPAAIEPVVGHLKEHHRMGRLAAAPRVNMVDG
jgi:hypothetical protein